MNKVTGRGGAGGLMAACFVPIGVFAVSIALIPAGPVRAGSDFAAGPMAWRFVGGMAGLLVAVTVLYSGLELRQRPRAGASIR